jgi:SnoaL-like domain
MKLHLFLIAVSISLFSCTSTTDENMTAENSSGNRNNQNIEVVKNYIKAVEAMNLDAMSEYLADNYVGMGPSYGDTITKEQAVENWKAYTDSLYEKIQYNRSRFAGVNIPDGDNKGDWVANWAELNIEFKDGRGSATIWANTNYQIENGKIVKSLTFYNEADALRQLGYTIMPPEEAE